MKKIICVLLSLFLFSFGGKTEKLQKNNNLIVNDKDSNKRFQDNQEISFTGKWEWKNKNKTSSFQLRIIQTGQELKGQYCAVQYSGNRMDCDFDTNFNIYGRVKDNKAIVKFNSFYGAKNGEAILNINKGKLFWKITKWPEGEDCFAPEKAILNLKI
jgi:hypothetical protein